MTVYLSSHARDKMAWLGISRNDVETAIKQGSKTKQKNGYLAVYRYIAVAYKIIGKNIYKVKTVYLI